LDVKLKKDQPVNPFLATEGDSLSDFVKNRQIVGYPDPNNDAPIEEEYKKEDNVRSYNNKHPVRLLRHCQSSHKTP
jgi:hypothetical protein